MWVFLGIMAFYAAIIAAIHFTIKYRERKAAEKRPVFKKNSDQEILVILLGLDDDSIEVLLGLYREEFGAGPARYARKTYRKWKTGKVMPVRQTFERFMLHLPRVMSFDLKCEVLRHLITEYAAKDQHEVTVSVADWESAVVPLVNQLIEKTYDGQLPRPVERKLQWLGDGDMVAARAILTRSRAEEARIAVSMLRDEFDNIKTLLKQKPIQARVEHKIDLPGGTILIHVRPDRSE